MNGSLCKPVSYFSRVVDEAFKSMYFKIVLADLRGMVATKTSMGWQLDCNSTLVESETRRPSSAG